MNDKHYDAWKKSRQIASGDINLAEAVMEQITLQARRPGGLKNSFCLILLNFIQARAFVRMCVLVSGALAGLVRTMFAFYALFA